MLFAKTPLCNNATPQLLDDSGGDDNSYDAVVVPLKSLHRLQCCISKFINKKLDEVNFSAKHRLSVHVSTCKHKNERGLFFVSIESVDARNVRVSMHRAYLLIDFPSSECNFAELMHSLAL